MTVFSYMYVNFIGLCCVQVDQGLTPSNSFAPILCNMVYLFPASSCDVWIQSTQLSNIYNYSV